MIDHIGFPVADFNRSKALYGKGAGAPSITLLAELTAEQTGGDAHACFGRSGEIGTGRISAGGAHVAFLAQSRAEVETFDNGAPELRPRYRPNYFAAFVLDPDNKFNIEAVCLPNKRAALSGRANSAPE
jgi:catechol 2,3-dioxygenase-like lactoylglutathione lyase family enzyme